MYTAYTYVLQTHMHARNMKWFFCSINHTRHYLCISGISCMFEPNKFARREKLEPDDFNSYTSLLEAMITI